MSELEKVIAEYNSVLASLGAASPSLISGGIRQETIDSLNKLDCVDITDELRNYLSIVTRYDFDKELELDSSCADYLWSMAVIPADKIIKNYETRLFVTGEDEDFWPKGFLPILQSNNSDFVMVNCRPDSPTRGAVYEYVDGEGTLYIASSLKSFIEGCTTIAKSGAIFFDDKDICEIKDHKQHWKIVSTTFQFRSKEPHELLHPRKIRNW